MDLIRTLAEDQQLVLNDIQARSSDLDATRAGTMTNTVAGVGAMLSRDAKRAALREVAKTFVATAAGADLDTLALDHFSLTRHSATAAVGQLRFLRPTSAIATVPAGTILIDPAGAEYSVIVDTAISGTAGIVSVAAVATGAATNRPAGTRFGVKDSAGAWLSSFPGLVIVALEQLAGGNDVETDADFRVRIAAWWKSLRRGTAYALRFAALSVPGVRRATVSEEHMRPDRGGWVDLFVTDNSDGFSWVLGNQVRAAIDEDGRAAGVIVNVWGAEVVYVAVRIKLTARPGVQPEAVTRAAAAVVQYFTGLAIGEGLSRARIAAAALASDAGFLDAQVLSPRVDLVATPRQVLRARAQEVTIE